ncbi:MAG TPA: hypothetical protein DCZ48_05675 [Methylococcaceae bacterium]|nr:hypothetical protein [Methylococcaceae bacterium]
MRYEFHPDALAEYEEATQYYAGCREGLEFRFIAAVEHAKKGGVLLFKANDSDNNSNPPHFCARSFLRSLEHNAQLSGKIERRKICSDAVVC